jgi:hypothetical protein
MSISATKVSFENGYVQLPVGILFKGKNPAALCGLRKGVLSYKRDGFSCKNNL